MRKLISFFVGLVVLSLASASLAQPDSCPAIVDNVLNSVDQNCDNTGRNQVCYGNVMIVPSLQPDVTSIAFEQVGDIADVAAFQSLTLSPINGDKNEWGVALMRLQANLPNTLPGQNVTFVLFGDVEMTSAVGPNSDASPMQAFYLSTGVGMSSCNEAPESGLLVQTPEGAGQIQFAMNGMNISLGSSAFIQAIPGENMNISMLDGAGALQVGETIIPALEGTKVSLPLAENLLVNDTFEINAFDGDVIQALPLNLLDETHFTLAEAMDDATLALLRERLQAGEPLCGNDLPWDCANLPALLGGGLCPLDESGKPDCDLPVFKWGDEGFGIASGILGRMASGASIQPRDGVWTTGEMTVTASAGCPPGIAAMMQINENVFPAERVVFPKPFEFGEFLSGMPDALPMNFDSGQVEPNVYEATFSIEGAVMTYRMEIISETETRITMTMDMNDAGFACVLNWEATGIHTSD